MFISLANFQWEILHIPLQQYRTHNIQQEVRFSITGKLSKICHRRNKTERLLHETMDMVG